MLGGRGVLGVMIDCVCLCVIIKVPLIYRIYPQAVSLLSTGCEWWFRCLWYFVLQWRIIVGHVDQGKYECEIIRGTFNV